LPRSACDQHGWASASSCGRGMRASDSDRCSRLLTSEIIFRRIRPPRISARFRVSSRLYRIARPHGGGAVMARLRFWVLALVTRCAPSALVEWWRVGWRVRRPRQG
jgi:hypothetical protein